VLGAALLVTGIVRAPRIAAGKAGDLDAPLLAYHRPAAEVLSFLEGVPGRAWNEMETGGALLWHAQGKRLVFMDGRGDFHALTGAYADADRIGRAGPGFEQVFAKWGMDLAIVSYTVERQGRGIDAPLVTRSRRPELGLVELGWWRAFETPLRKDRALLVLVRPGSDADRVLRARGVRPLEESR
jgi:hypothetical protein